MMKTLIGLCFFLLVNSTFAQSIKEKLDAAVKKLEADSQMRHAIVGFCVVDTKTGLPVYEHNSQVGLAPASTQKLFTSGAAFELLKHDYRFATWLGYNGEIDHGTLKGDIVITGTSDPTLGSWRFKETNDTVIFNKWIESIKKLGINTITGSIFTIPKSKATELDAGKRWSDQATPGGWIWDDIGNYYGAGADIINWRENQFDVIFYPGTEGNRVDSFILSPKQYGVILSSQVIAGPAGSGDNSYIYLAPGTFQGVIRGTIPSGVKNFTISGASPLPYHQMVFSLREKLELAGIKLLDRPNSSTVKGLFSPQTITRTDSPTLDSINYWFLRKSINLYGEALIKAIAFEDGRVVEVSTETGVDLVKDFWSKHGIEKSSLHIIDGSGLSPQNRVTTDALVKVLQYAKTRPWYNSFYYALPEYNGMKMKSGSIGGARSFAGYHTSKDGREYSYAIIINNYDGSSSRAVRKMYEVLDLLK